MDADRMNLLASVNATAFHKLKETVESTRSIELRPAKRENPGVNLAKTENMTRCLGARINMRPTYNG